MKPNKDYDLNKKKELISDYTIQNKQEKEEVLYLEALNNCSVLDKILPFIAILESLIILLSNLYKDADFMKFQTLYNILYSSLVVFSIVIYIINRSCLQKIHLRRKTINVITHLFVCFVILWNVFMLCADFRTVHQVDFALFFTSILVSVIMFNLSPFVIIPVMIFAFALIFIEVLFVQKFDLSFLYKPNLYLFMILGFLCVVIRRVNLIFRAKQKIRLKEAISEAENANRAKSTFLATMSHEIRTPMNAIIGFSDIALKEDVSPKIKDYLEKINRASNTLLTIINDILDFSKIESGKLEIVPADYNLETLMSDLESIVRVRISSKSVKLFIEIEKNVPRFLFGDDIRIKQILLNLAGNATKFTEDGEIRISVKATETKENYAPGEKINLTFSVKDTGLGIKQEDLKKIFNSFEQVDMLVNRKKEGSGLGLAISKQLVTLMNGTFGVESEYGKGSNFYFTIPQTVSAQKEQSDEKSFDFIAPDAKVLVVDDNEVNLLVAQGYLARYKCQVETCFNGKEALDLVKSGKNYDIIFMDHMMPVMDGEEATNLIREYEKSGQKKNRIVALTANAIDGAREKFLSLGFDDFLSKPMVEKDLEKVMKNNLPKEKCVILENKIENAEQKPNPETPEDFGVTDEILKMFYNQIPKKTQMISDFYKNAISGDDDALKNFQIEVHALKTSSRICGFPELSEKSLLLEKAAAEKNRKLIEENIQNFLELYENAKISLEKKLNLSENEEELVQTDEKPVSKEEMHDFAQKMIVFSQNGDLNSAEKEFNSFKKKNIPQEFKSYIENLTTYIEEIDFDKIIEISEKI